MRTSHARLVLVDAASQPEAEAYVPPYSVPTECAHRSWVRCWLCCPCGECGSARLAFEADGARPAEPGPGGPALTLVR